MIIDLSCPIELRGYELLQDDHGNARAYLKLFNLSNQIVTGYSATVCWFNGLTRASITENIEVGACELAPKSAFKLVHSTRDTVAVDYVELYFSSVSFANGEIWRPKDGDLIEIGEQPRLEGAQLDMLKRAAGRDAVQYPQVQKNYWRCVCGRINLLEDESCARCERSRNEVLIRLNEKAIRNGAERNNKRPSPDREYGQRPSNGWRTFLTIAVLLVLLALAAVAGFRFGKSGGPKIPAATDAPIHDDSAPVTLYSPYCSWNMFG